MDVFIRPTKNCRSKVGLAIADAAALKRGELVYDDETGHWCVDTDRQ